MIFVYKITMKHEKVWKSQPRPQAGRKGQHIDTHEKLSGGFRGGSKGSLEPPSGTKLFHFHGEFQYFLFKIRQTNPLLYI